MKLRLTYDINGQTNTITFELTEISISNLLTFANDIIPIMEQWHGAEKEGFEIEKLEDLDE